MNYTKLSDINFDRNDNFNTECFELLIGTLHDKSTEELSFKYCNITDISAIQTNALPKLDDLNLSGNNIGREGCRALGGLLKKKGSTLKVLALDDCGIDNEGAVILATLLKNNNTLETLYLRRSSISEKGHIAFLKLLNDISSIDGTCNSNHTLRDMSISGQRNETIDGIVSCLQTALSINHNANFFGHNPVRAKIIQSQLNSQTRKKYCHLQGIEYSFGNLLADVEPALLPCVLALIGEKHGHSEFYTSLIPLVPDLMSFLDTRGMIEDLLVKNKAHDNDLVVQIAELTRQRAALSAKNDQLSRRLAAKQSGDSHHSTIEEGSGETVEESAKKRQRS